MHILYTYALKLHKYFNTYHYFIFYYDDIMNKIEQKINKYKRKLYQTNNLDKAYIYQKKFNYYKNVQSGGTCPDMLKNYTNEAAKCNQHVQLCKITYENCNKQLQTCMTNKKNFETTYQTLYQKFMMRKQQFDQATALAQQYKNALATMRGGTNGIEMKESACSIQLEKYKKYVMDCNNLKKQCLNAYNTCNTQLQQCTPEILKNQQYINTVQTQTTVMEQQLGQLLTAIEQDKQSLITKYESLPTIPITSVLDPVKPDYILSGDPKYARYEKVFINRILAEPNDQLRKSYLVKFKILQKRYYDLLGPPERIPPGKLNNAYGYPMLQVINTVPVILQSIENNFDRIRYYKMKLLR